MSDQQSQSTTETTVVSVHTLAKWSNHVVKRAATEAYTATLREVNRKTAERQAAEDIRANKRNLNRMLTLMGALMIGLVVTYLLSHPAMLDSIGIPSKTAEALAPYSFVITIILDSSLALYSLVKKY